MAYRLARNASFDDARLGPDDDDDGNMTPPPLPSSDWGLEHRDMGQFTRYRAGTPGGVDQFQLGRKTPPTEGPSTGLDLHPLGLHGKAGYRLVQRRQYIQFYRVIGPCS